jgi:exonuclease SbcC
MKILSLTFKNINALKGRWHIDFTGTFLKDAGIFVICGPTGSGKTSILDAITLALYGETDRLPKKNIENIMTRHTGDCFCEVVFQVNENIYKSHWSIRRSRGKPDGKIQLPKRLLYDLSSNEPQVIAEKIKYVQEKIESITGLDFKRFSRSMMLAQGRFAEFLNAPDRERAELLEKITGTDIYTKLSIKAFERAKEEKEKLNNLRTIADQSFETLSDDAIEKFQKELISTNDNAAQIKQTIQSLQLKKEQLKRIDRLLEEKKRATENLQIAHKKESELHTEKYRLTQSNLAREFQSELDSVKVQKKRLEELTSDIQSIDKQLADHKAQFKKMSLNLSDSQNQFDIAKKIQADSDPLLQKAFVLDKEIETFKNHCESIQKEQKKFFSSLADLKRSQDKTEKDLKKTLHQQQKNAQWLNQNTHNENLSEHIPYIKDDLNELQDIRQHYISRQKKMAQLKKQLSALQKKIKKKQSMYQTTQKNLDEIIQTIHKEERHLRKYLGGQTIEDLENQFNESTYHYHLLENHQKLSNQFIDLKNATKNLRKQLKKTILSEYHMNKKQQQLLEHIAKENETLKALSLAVQHEMLVASYSDQRHLLETGKPCPLCGSINHPYVISKKNSSGTQIQKEFEKKEKQIKDLNHEREFQKNESVKYNTLMKSQIATILQNTNRLSDIHNEWEMAMNDLSFLPPIHQGEAIKDCFKELKLRTDMIQKRYHTSKKIFERTNKLRNSLQEKKENCFAIKDEISTLDFQIKKMTHDIQEISSQCDEIQTRGKKISQEASSLLTRYQLIIPESGKENDFIEMLNQKVIHYNNHAILEKNLEKDIQQLSHQSKAFTIELKTISERCNELNEQKIQWDTKLIHLKDERYQLLGKKNPEQEKKRLMADVETYEKQLNDCRSKHLTEEKTINSMETLKRNKQDDFSQTQISFENESKSLLNRIQPKGFQNIEHLQTSILSLKESKEIQNRLDQHERTIHQEQTRLNDISDQLQSEKNNLLTEESLESLESKLINHENEYETLTKRSGSIEQLLCEEIKRTEARKKTIQKLKIQELQFNRWSDLNQLIGSADGNIFRTFAQGLTLNRLIEFSNQHLKHLSDRYLLQRISPQSLTLNIMDTYQANTLRPTNTLSGGESFLVSLSMALGLSDLAGNNVRVESLFLDEGFGALDDETLDIALNAVERLNLSGKMIGVISHIESLKERIPAHIEVSKMAGGNSRIDIVSSNCFC